MNMRTVNVVGTVLLAFSSVGSALAQQAPPPALPLDAVDFPDYEEVTLSSGAKVLIVENHEQPVVTVNLRIKSGSAYDPDGRGGLASLTAAMLNKGTMSRDARQIAESIDFIGASIGAGAGEDWTSVTATTLTEFLDEALEIMADMVINPTFPQAEFDIERKRLLTGLQVELSQPEAVASRRFIEHVYGEHPYGNLITEESLQSIGRADMVEFHRKNYRPDNALFVVAGSVEHDEIVQKLKRHFGGWEPAPVEDVAMSAPPTRGERTIHFYHKPGSVQAVIRIGHLMPPATHSDWVALDVGMQVLGGGSTSWLFQVLRQEKGYTYGSYASAAKRIDRGTFQAYAEVRNEVADSSMTEMLGLIERIRSEPAPDADLELAKDFLTGSFPRQIETPQQVAGQVATARMRGLADDYLETYRERVAAVSAAEVQRVAAEHLQPDKALVVVVGDATEIYDKVAPFGAVMLFDVEGNPTTLAGLAVKAAAFTFDATGIQATTLVYSLNFQGNPVGEITTQVSRESLDGRDVVRSKTAGGAMTMTMEQEVVFEAETFTGIESHASQKMGDRGMDIDLRLEGGVVTGTVAGMSAEPQQINAEVVDGTLLPGMDDYMIWLADLDANKEIDMPAFNALSGSPYTYKLEVVGETTVTVPAGEFEAYQLKVISGQGEATIYARRQAPHIVLRQEPAGQPLVIELKEIR
jgi:predicted Zn-dependent peptidase